jgi:glutathionylspermidine synthase
VNNYAGFAAQLQATGIVADPWLEGAPRFRPEPVVLTAARWRELTAAAAGIARVHDELARLVAAAPELADTFFGLTPWQRGMWRCSAPDWHGIARADVFWTRDGAKVCELNSDTPSGQAETVLGNTIAHRDHAHLHDPNAQLPARFVAMVETWAATVAAPGGSRGPLTVGILYPTEISEDLSMVAAYRQWLGARGHRVVVGSPFNVGLAADGRAVLLDTPCDVIVRHYKTDWFGERLPVADDDEPCEDREPLRAPLLALLQAAVERRTALVNPFGAVLTQNKRALAFCHEEIARFSPEAQQAIRRWLPFSRRLELVRDELWAEQDRWVLKSDYGCEGAEVVIGARVDRATWEATLAHVIARRWIAQERFEPEVDAAGDVVNGVVVNHGVWLVGGAPAGVLARVHGPDATTAADARMAPVFVEPAAARTEPG